MACRQHWRVLPAGQHRRGMQERRNFTRPREIGIGKTVAHCQRCRCEHFIRSREKMDMMRCLACRAEYPYTILLAQIAAENSRRADEVPSKAEALQGQSRRSLRK
jgi:hypothetical protein